MGEKYKQAVDKARRIAELAQWWQCHTRIPEFDLQAVEHEARREAIRTGMHPDEAFVRAMMQYHAGLTALDAVYGCPVDALVHGDATEYWVDSSTLEIPESTDFSGFRQEIRERVMNNLRLALDTGSRRPDGSAVRGYTFGWDLYEPDPRAALDEYESARGLPRAA